jgi:hypothetical protein
MNEVYWSCEAQRYGSRDRSLTVATAVLSSATVVALFSPFPPVGKVLAILASILSLVHATTFSKARVKQISGLASSYKELAIEFKLLWGQAQSTKAEDVKHWKEYEVLARREKKIDESAFHINNKRMKSAQAQVRRARGLEDESRPSRTTTTTATTAAGTASTAGPPDA